MPPILHKDWQSYYWKNTYTYGPWPPDPKKEAPKKQTSSKAIPKVSFAPEDSVIPMDESYSPVVTESANEVLGHY